MIKQPFEYVSKELDKLYEKQFDESDIEGINNHCEFISAFVHACGYTEEEIIDLIMRFEPSPETNKGLN